MLPGSFPNLSAAFSAGGVRYIIVLAFVASGFSRKDV